ncbi:unnamed protein product [Musa acuminata subsp. malaccensis]|uniref:(wild Malaysian banana) hypothetical protein n=1 Tax=Musa acuminata subsp. malaccensis TaxID=214687 RepID=A0A804KY74_MUSAM|nr:unnamed protein product [Musa acuminata subsp. malaccensis]
MLFPAFNPKIRKLERNQECFYLNRDFAVAKHTYYMPDSAW